MNWSDAKREMLAGRHVVRASLRKRETITPASDHDAPVIDCGTEPMKLAAAWTSDDRPVYVFAGAFSGVLFVPELDDMKATDWICA